MLHFHPSGLFNNHANLSGLNSVDGFFYHFNGFTTNVMFWNAFIHFDSITFEWQTFFKLSRLILVYDRQPVISQSASDYALYRLFPNYAGNIHNGFGSYPVSYLELSRPTGKYVSRLVLRELNLFIRRHSVLMIGNTCAPGYFFPQLENSRGLEQFEREKTNHCGVFIANILKPDGVSSDAVVFEAEPFMVLKLREQWQSFEDYLGDMTSKYRVRSKKVLSLSNHIESTAYTGETLDPGILKVCSKLLHETLKEKTLLLNKDLGGIMLRFSEHFGDDFKILVYSKNEKPIGFISYSIKAGTLHAWHVGYEESIARETHIYQRMLYDLVKTGIENGCESINFGRTATEIKSTLGAEPIENHFVVFAQSKILRAMIRYYKKHHYRPKQYTLRRPFH